MNRDLEEAKAALLECFPNSFVNDIGEFIAHLRSNTYFILHNCETPLDIECKVLEWLSRAACKGLPFSQEWRNEKFREFMRNGINDFLNTNFSEEHFYEIIEYDPDDEALWIGSIEQAQGEYEIIAWHPLPQPCQKGE